MEGELIIEHNSLGSSIKRFSKVAINTTIKLYLNILHTGALCEKYNNIHRCVCKTYHSKLMHLTVSNPEIIHSTSIMPITRKSFLIKCHTLIDVTLQFNLYIYIYIYIYSDLHKQEKKNQSCQCISLHMRYRK
jgi:hypothetical protein